MAKAAGFEVTTTCGSHTLQYCKDIGADYVFDHKQEDVVEQIVRALEGKESAGVFDAVMPEDTIVKCAEIAHRVVGKKHVATVMVGPPTPQCVPQGLPEDVMTSYCWNSTTKKDEVGPAVWCEWVTAALARGQLKCKPDALVIGEGLECIQEACERMLKGVSAQKLVVKIP